MVIGRTAAGQLQNKEGALKGFTGRALPSGSRYVVDVPDAWNGVALLYSHPVPTPTGEAPRSDPLVTHLVGRGYAVARSTNSMFWPLELAFTDQPALLDIVERDLSPRHTIALGLSIGGIISAALVQLWPQRLSGALPICGNLAGAVATHDRELDIAYVVKTLLAEDSALEITNITDPGRNLRRAMTVLAEAQQTASGRARVALAAAVGNVPGWHDPLSAEPHALDHAARQRNQFAWFREVGFLVFFWAREQVERQAGGNPSRNSGVDYGELLAASINCDEVDALYAAAGLDLGEDLGRLATGRRIEADADARGYLERHIVFSGDLGGVPVLTLHTDGDGLVPPDHERAYAEVVGHAGQQDLLRQLYVHRGGHCTMTFAETVTALDVLTERIESGTWPHLDPAGLNVAADRLGPDCNVLNSGESMERGFVSFEPPPFFRRYDVRQCDAAGAMASGANQ